jgi:hypothetical protein
MQENSIYAQTVCCRLALIEPSSMRIMTINSDSGPLLPCESIHTHSRFAEALTQAVEQIYGLRTIQLALLPGSEEQGYCAVHEILASRSTLSEFLSPVALHEIEPDQLTAEEKAMVIKIMNGHAMDLGRFARVGWISELLCKTESLGISDRMPLVRQLNQGIDFSLLQLTYEDSRSIWFKAVGEPNTHEYALTIELSRQFPMYLPKILACIPDWKGWVSEHVAGVPLNDLCEMHAWGAALEALAVMQKSAIHHTGVLRKAGAKDWGCERLASLSAPFFEDVQRAMLAQGSTKARPLDSGEVRSVRGEIERALVTFTQSGMPDTLLHGDIGHGNILIASDRIVFLDWAETYIGHPFVSAEHLLADYERSQPSLSRGRNSLRQAYAAHWLDVVSSEDLVRTTLLAPAVAAFAYAITVWAATVHGPDPSSAWPVIRSMVRRVKRELDNVPEVAA